MVSSSMQSAWLDCYGLHFQAGVKSSGLSKQVLAHFPAKFPLIMLIRVPDNCDLSCSAC